MNNAYDMGMKYRAMAKSMKLPKKAAEEFFKLSLDCGYDAYDCRSIREIIHKYLRCRTISHSHRLGVDLHAAPFYSCAGIERAADECQSR